MQSDAWSANLPVPMMKRRPDLAANIERIADYTGKHAALRQAHHFLYDLRSPPDCSPRFVVMGINPGETERDWKLSPQPTEETSRFDFHQRSEKTGSALRWAKLSSFYLDGSDYVLAEVFFWSSRDLGQFRTRYGPLKASPHLAFCRDMNLELIDFHQPEAVISPGLGSAALCSKLYGLRHVATIREGDARVAESYHDGLRPWLFTKHWTGAFGLSDAQRNRIREAIRALTSPATEIVVHSTPARQPPASPNPQLLEKLASSKEDAVSVKLRDCSAAVQSEVSRLHARLTQAGADQRVVERNGPGWRYLRADGLGWIIRIHPKLRHIALGFPNTMRDQVEATGLLRPQRDAAWINYDPAAKPQGVDNLLDAAFH